MSPLSSVLSETRPACRHFQYFNFTLCFTYLLYFWLFFGFYLLLFFPSRTAWQTSPPVLVNLVKTGIPAFLFGICSAFLKLNWKQVSVCSPTSIFLYFNMSIASKVLLFNQQNYFQDDSASLVKRSRDHPSTTDRGAIRDGSRSSSALRNLLHQLEEGRQLSGPAARTPLPGNRCIPGIPVLVKENCPLALRCSLVILNSFDYCQFMFFQLLFLTIY